MVARSVTTTSGDCQNLPVAAGTASSSASGSVHQPVTLANVKVEPRQEPAVIEGDFVGRKSSVGYGSDYNYGAYGCTVYDSQAQLEADWASWQADFRRTTKRAGGSRLVVYKPYPRGFF